MKILHFTLAKKWFDMILSGEKKEEYREIKPYWERRLYHALYPTITQFADFDAIEFRNGYAKDAPTMIVECKGVTAGIGNPAWGAHSRPVFIIELGEILETKNIKL